MRDAADAVRGASAYPALAATLERAGVSEIAVYAAAMRRAGTLTAIEDESRAHRGLAHVPGRDRHDRDARRLKGSITPDAASKLIASLSAIPLSERGDYEGRLAAWLNTWLMPGGTAWTQEHNGRRGRWLGRRAVRDGKRSDGRTRAPGAHRTSVADGASARLEGTRYRVDFPRADADRITRAAGPPRVPTRHHIGVLDIPTCSASRPV